MTLSKILVVDDEVSIRKLVSAYLTPEGYQVYTAGDGIEALKAARAYRQEVVVLDLMLPGMDGLEVLAQLRRESDAYVILLTARAEETDKIVGLAVGADDYVTKPFSQRELVARVKAGLRRMQSGARQEEGGVIRTRHVRIDVGSRQVWVRLYAADMGDERLVELTALEFDLLKTLAEHKGRVFNREKLLEMVWGYDYFGEPRVVDVHIGHLRQKLGDERLIATVRVVGYRFEDEAD